MSHRQMCALKKKGLQSCGTKVLEAFRFTPYSTLGVFLELKPVKALSML